MSWSVSTKGSKEDAMKNAAQQFDSQAVNYIGNDEQRDIYVAKERALSAIEQLSLDPATQDVNVSAYGSRSTVDGKPISVEIHVNVSRGPK